jgi:hypothetical protein
MYWGMLCHFPSFLLTITELENEEEDDKKQEKPNFAIWFFRRGNSSPTP